MVAIASLAVEIHYEGVHQVNLLLISLMHTHQEMNMCNHRFYSWVTNFMGFFCAYSRYKIVSYIYEEKTVVTGRLYEQMES